MATLTMYSNPYLNQEDRLRQLSLEQTLAQIAENPDPPSQDTMSAYIDNYHNQLRAMEYATHDAPQISFPTVPSPRSQHGASFEPTSSMSSLPNLDFMGLNTNTNDSSLAMANSPPTEFINYTTPTTTSLNLPTKPPRGKKRKRKSFKRRTTISKTKTAKEIALSEEVTKDLKESPEPSRNLLETTKEQTEHFDDFDISPSRELLRLQLVRNKDSFEKNKVAVDFNMDVKVGGNVRKRMAVSVPGSPVGFRVKVEGDERFIGLGILGLKRPATVVPRV